MNSVPGVVAQAGRLIHSRPLAVLLLHRRLLAKVQLGLRRSSRGENLRGFGRLADVKKDLLHYLPIGGGFSRTAMIRSGCPQLGHSKLRHW